MSDSSIPYRHHEFYTPKISPFDTAGSLIWPTLVGTFLRPIIKSAPDMKYWFCYHGADFQFCFAHEEYEKIELVIEEQKKKFGTTSKVLPTEGITIGTAFRGTRWISADKIGNTDLESVRSNLILSYLNSVSGLYLDTLIPHGIHWKAERNSDGENPLGSNFESLAHLLANISRFGFGLEPPSRTAWMDSARGPQPIGHL